MRCLYLKIVSIIYQCVLWVQYLPVGLLSCYRVYCFQILAQNEVALTLHDSVLVHHNFQFLFCRLQKTASLGQQEVTVLLFSMPTL